MYKNSGKLDNHFDKDAVQAELDAQRATVQQFGQTVADVKTATMDYFGKADKEAKEKAQTEYEQAQATYQANPISENKTKEDMAKAVYNIAKEQAPKWEVGGEYRRNVDMATNVLTVALSGGTPAEMLASGASPIINNKIKELTKDNKVANIMAHAAWGAIEATAAKGNASAGAVAATSAEIAAPMLAETLYGTSDPEKLSNEQRQTIVDLSSAIAGITSGLVSSTGNSVEISQAVKKGSEIGVNAVENNAVNKSQAGTLDGFVYTMTYESPSKMGGAVGYEAEKQMLRLSELDSKFNPATTPYFNNVDNRYVYTKNGGWIDMVHFLFYAGEAYKMKKNFIDDVNYLIYSDINSNNIINEYIKSESFIYHDKWLNQKATSYAISKAVQKGYWQEYIDSRKSSAKHSAYTFEDLPSDRYGALFGAKYFDKKSNLTLGEQISSYLKNELKATSPELAPNYKSLPDTDDKVTHPGIINKTTKPLFTIGRPND